MLRCSMPWGVGSRSSNGMTTNELDMTDLVGCRHSTTMLAWLSLRNHLNGASHNESRLPCCPSPTFRLQQQQDCTWLHGTTKTHSLLPFSFMLNFSTFDNMSNKDEVRCSIEPRYHRDWHLYYILAGCTVGCRRNRVLAGQPSKL